MEIKNIIIYRDHLLYPSETFVLAQGEGLRRFQPYYVGSRRVRGLELPGERVITINNGNCTGKFREALFKTTGLEINLVKRLQTLKPVLLHAHFGSDGVLALPLARKLGVPLVVTFHGFDANIKDEYARRSFFSHRLLVRKRAELQRRASLFIAVSGFIRNQMIARGYPEEKIIRHYTGVDVERFQPDDSIYRASVVLFAGRLVENKGCAYLIRAMARVQQALPETELVIIGDGPEREALQQLATRLPGRYRFLGVQSQATVRLWMNRARVFCVPSVTIETGESEALGMVFVEAGAMGLPVVSFAIGGIPEVVSHGETGFLAPERDWEKLACYLQLLLENQALWKRFSAGSRIRVLRHFNLQRQTARLENIYATVISDRIRYGFASRPVTCR